VRSNRSTYKCPFPRTGHRPEYRQFAGVRKSNVGDLDFDGTRKRHHRILVFGSTGESRIGQLHDPAAAHAVNRDRESAFRIATRRKLELHTGEGKAQQRRIGAV
jgi:hypothetical protein